MLVDNDALGPWPDGCDPEQCPYVAELFLRICDELNGKSDIPNNKKAVWDAGTFGFAARRIRGNANMLQKSIGLPKRVDSKVKALLDQYYKTRYELGKRLDDKNDRMDFRLYASELAKMNSIYFEKIEAVMSDG